MNKGNLANHPNQYETGEIRFGVEPPNNDVGGWIKADGTPISRSHPLYNKFLKNPSSWATVPLTWLANTGPYSAVYGNGLWVVVGGNNNLIKTSTDLVTWTTRITGGTSILSYVVYGNGIFVASGLFGSTTRSTDGITWGAVSINVGINTTYGLAYDNSTWLATGNAGFIRTSTDGATWTTRTSPTGATLFMPMYAVGNWYVGDQNGFAYKSTDAVTWTTYTQYTPGFAAMQSARYVNGVAYVGGYQNFSTSTDLVTWTKVPGLGDIYLIAGGDDVVAVGSGGGMYMSTNGTTWVNQNLNGGVIGGSWGSQLAAAYYNGIWLVVGGESNQPSRARTNVIGLPYINLGNNIWGWIKK